MELHCKWKKRWKMDIVDLYKNCYKELYNYVYAITLNIYDTEDIVQYTFFKAFKKV